MERLIGYTWSRVSYNGITGYVITGALTYDVPAETPEDPEEIDDSEDDIEDENLDDIDENEEILKTLAEELGSLPEVGINIMPFIFLGSVIACLVMCYEIKFKKNKVIDVK